MISDKALRAITCLEYHVRNNLWTVQFGSYHGTDEPFGGCWRLVCAPCLADVEIDVRGATWEACLEAAFDRFRESFISEAETQQEDRHE